MLICVCVCVCVSPGCGSGSSRHMLLWAPPSPADRNHQVRRLRQGARVSVCLSVRGWVTHGVLQGRPLTPQPNSPAPGRSIAPVLTTRSLASSQPRLARGMRVAPRGPAGLGERRELCLVGYLAGWLACVRSCSRVVFVSLFGFRISFSFSLSLFQFSIFFIFFLPVHAHLFFTELRYSFSLFCFSFIEFISFHIFSGSAQCFPHYILSFSHFFSPLSNSFMFFFQRLKL